ncbi:hypothetical protein NLJ89_g9612 [Agrocybe chaxingu]|uniref:Uncharacterized protein n=1 Tax=Agrocybe chaxingu TaxID=84603 RepID=A0A9W8MPP6_9AGAR|nr:hypothetical protein NLJ89_g9612 [Agrocybe chaxingu]
MTNQNPNTAVFLPILVPHLFHSRQTVRHHHPPQSITSQADSANEDAGGTPSEFTNRGSPMSTYQQSQRSDTRRSDNGNGGSPTSSIDYRLRRDIVDEVTDIMETRLQGLVENTINELVASEVRSVLENEFNRVAAGEVRSILENEFDSIAARLQTPIWTQLLEVQMRLLRGEIETSVTARIQAEGANRRGSRGPEKRAS